MSSKNTILVKFLSIFFVVSMVLPLSFTPVKVLASQVDNGGQCVTEIVSDAETKVDGSASVATYDGHIDWNASIPGATWIWSSYHVEDPLVVTTKTFTREFNLASGSVADSILTIAADNNFKVFVNGTEVASDLSGDNFFDVKTYNISSNLKAGANTIAFEITNITHPQALTPETNPAGLLYSLKVVQDGSCSGSTPNNPPAQDPTVSLNANPSTINRGETSTLSWVSTNADSCSSTWFDGMGTSGNTTVSPATTTEYVVSCVGNSKTVYATTTVTVNANNPGPGPSCTIDIVSDTTNTVNGTSVPAIATYKDNPRWTALIPGATWIWNSLFVQNPAQDEYYTFLKQFNVTDISKVKSASLVVAADNSYTVNLNGTEFAADATETNYFDEEKDTYDVKSRLINGNNAIYFVVKNWAIEGSTAETNPAGLLYKLSITLEGGDCGGNGGPTNTPPVITLIGNNPLTHTVNTPFVDPGATSTDAQDGDLTSQIVASSTVNASTTGTYTITYSVVDSGGLGATTTRTVNVVDGNGGGNGGTTTPSVTLTSNPSSIAPGATSTLSWNSTNTNYCSAAWTTSTSTSGTAEVSPATTTEYSISCGGSYGTTTATTTVTVTTGGNGGGGNPSPSITLTANPSSITLGASSTINWTSTNTNYCTAGWTTSTSTSGSMEVAPTTTTDYSISCGGNYGTTTATTTVTVNTDNGGNGGGGNGGGGNGGGGSSNIGGRRRDISNLLAPQGEVLGATSCTYLRDHLKMGWNNDLVEMLKLKSFLNIFEKETLTLDGSFDQATFDAVSRFQNKYFSEVLEPWGHTAPTGFVYITTKKKINEIYCNTSLTVTPAEAAEIAAFKAMIESGSFSSSFGNPNSGILSGLYEGEEDVVVANAGEESDENATTSTSTTPVSVVKNMAVSLFSIPEGLQNFFGNSRNVIFAIIALIVLSVVARMFLYSGDDAEDFVVESSNAGASLSKKDSSPVIILPGEKKENQG